MFGLSPKAALWIAVIHTIVFGFVYLRQPWPKTGDEFGPPWVQFACRYDLPMVILMAWFLNLFTVELLYDVNPLVVAIMIAIAGAFQWIVICALVRVAYLRLDRLAHDMTEIDERIRKRREKSRKDTHL